MIDKEKIMEQACDLCRWPFVYHDEETLHRERCAICPFEKLLDEATQEAKT